MPRRDAAPPSQDSATAVIKGRVVALDSGTPLRRVMLRLSGEKLRQGRATVTDAQGRYEFKDLTAGRYTLSASKGGYVTLQYGQRGPKESGRALELTEHQTLDKIDIALPRGAVITGRVVDETGEAVADAVVLALQYRMISGKRRLMPMNAGRPNSTNDIGQYRLFGLPPGEYYLSASMRQGAMMGPEALMDDGAGYAPTFYPGTPSAAEAQRLTVGVGEETVADIQIVPSKVAHVSGTVVSSAGKAPAMGFVSLQARGSDITGSFLNGGGGQIRADGSFTINSVNAGSYQLIVMATPSETMSSDAFETASMPITVSGQDITDLRLATSKGVSVSGHVTFEGGTPDAAALKQFRPGCFPTESESMPSFSRPGEVKEQGQFEIVGLTVPCVVGSFGSAPGWELKSVQLNGVDVTERPVEPAGRPITGFEITFTNRLTTLSGSVQDAENQPAKEYTVIAFPEEAQKWQSLSARRYLRRARPDQEGAFKFTGLPPARYLLVAFDSVEEGLEMDPEFLAKIQLLAVRVELGEGGAQSVSLKMNKASY